LSLFRGFESGLAALCAVVAVLLSGLAGCAAAPDDDGTVIDGDLTRWREAATVHASVATARGREGKALAFTRGGISLPTRGRLAAGAGSVDLWCAPSAPWPDDADRTLLHVGDTGHRHVTLFARKGRLLAVYKGGAEHHASISHDARAWTAGEWHHVQMSWEGGKGTGAVTFFLRVDGKIVGTSSGRRVDPWPAKLHVATRGGRAGWRGLIDHVRLHPEPIVPPEHRPGRSIITVDADRTLGPCYNFWSTSNFTSQHMFVDPKFTRRLETTHPFLRYVNCVRLLGGRSDKRNRFYLGANAGGTIRTDFTDLRRYLRAIVRAGYTPRIVLDNVPTAMSDAKELHTYGNTAPPKDAAVWEQYVRGAVQAMVDEFGAETVRRWRFRAGTEPDLHPGHWSGTKGQYLDHYAATVKAVTSVIPDAEIGPGNILNPAKTFKTPEGPAWGLDIIDYAAKARLPLKYFSCSWYGRVGRPIDSFERAIGMMRDRLGRYPQFRGVPVEVAEFAILSDERGRRLYGGDITEWGASFYAAIADDVYRLNVARVHEWAQTTAGVRHPRANVIAMLEKMVDGRRLAVRADTPPGARCGAIGVRKASDLWVLVYHHRPARTPRVDQKVSLTVTDSRMAAGQGWRMDRWLIDHYHGVWARRYYADCTKAGIAPLKDAPLFGGLITRRFGKPGRKLFETHRAVYEKLAALPRVAADAPLTVANGKAAVDLTLHGHAVSLIRLRPGEQ